jgi:hypothetical protein
LIRQAATQDVLGPSEKDLALRVKSAAEKVLHSRDRGKGLAAELNEEEAFNLIRDTVRVVEAVLSH